MLKFLGEWLLGLIAIILASTFGLLVLFTFCFCLVGGPAMFVSKANQDTAAMISSFSTVLLMFLVITCPAWRDTGTDTDER